MTAGETAMAERRFLSALNAFKRANEARNRTSAEALIGMSRASYALKVFSDALKSADEALKHASRNATLEAAARYQRALALAESAEFPGEPALEEAEREFAAAARLDPTFRRPSVERARALLLSYRDEAALAELNRVVSAGPDTGTLAAARRLIEDPREVRRRFAAPLFSLTTSAGQTLSNPTLAGQVVLLDFWGTWCPPCRAATPALLELNQRYGSQTTMIGIGALEETREIWSDYVAQHRMTWPQYLDSLRSDFSDPAADRGPVATAFGVGGFPTYIVIDREGIVRGRLNDVGELETVIVRAIATPSLRGRP
jgi:thiol-disulfide isomerase/thioredoxin